MRSLAVLAVLVATAAGATEAEVSKAELSEAEARRTFLGLSVLRGASSLGSLGVEVERALGERISVRLGVWGGADWNSSETQGHVSHTRDFHLGADPGVRFYLTGRAPSGLWVGPNLELHRTWTTSEYPTRALDGAEGLVESHWRRWSVGAAGLVGYSMVLREGLTVQAAVGFGGSQGWFRGTSIAGLLGTLAGQQQQVQPAQEYRSTSWSFGERVSLAVGWAF